MSMNWASARTTFYIVVFFWAGLYFAYTTLDGLPREEWAAQIIKLGLSVTVALVLVEVVFQVIGRRKASPVSEPTP